MRSWLQTPASRTLPSPSNSEVRHRGEPAPAAPTGLTATLDTTVPQVNLAWTDNATNETGYVVERSDNGGAFTLIATLPADIVSYTDTTVASGNPTSTRLPP